MYLKDVMSKNVISITRETTLKGAHHIMSFHGIRHLPVIDKGKVVGLLSEADCRQIIDEIASDPQAHRVWKTSASEFMTKDYISAPQDAFLRRVAVKLINNEKSAVLVFEDDDLVGIATIKDMFNLIINIMEFDEPGVRIQIKNAKKDLINVFKILIDQKEEIKSFYYVPYTDGTKAAHIRLGETNTEEIKKLFKKEDVTIRIEE